jgi:glycosyltransferase involved in cell wall biosynthesis
MEPEGFAAIGLKEKGAVSKILQESLWKISETVHKPCDMVIAPTEYVGNDLRSRWTEVKVRVIPGAVELSAFSKNKYRDVLRNKYNLNNSTVFLSAGRLSAEKHYDVLITAFSMMLMKYLSARLVFIRWTS